MTESWAESITLDANGTHYVIKFSSCSTDTMRDAATLAFKQGAWADLPMQTKDGGWVMRVGILAHKDLSATLGALKQVFRPRIGISFGRFALHVWACRAGVHAGKVATSANYLPHFIPADEPAFSAELKARLDLVDLRSFMAPDDHELQRENENRLAKIVETAINLSGAATQTPKVEFVFCCTTPLE